MGLIILKSIHFQANNFVKFAFADAIMMMPKLCAPSTYASKHKFCIEHIAKYAALKLFADEDIQEWHQFKVNKDKKKTFCFVFWLMAGKNVDFVVNDFGTNGSLGEVKMDFSCRVYLYVNTGVSKTVIDKIF